MSSSRETLTPESSSSTSNGLSLRDIDLVLFKELEELKVKEKLEFEANEKSKKEEAQRVSETPTRNPKGNEKGFRKIKTGSTPAGDYYFPPTKSQNPRVTVREITSQSTTPSISLSATPVSSRATSRGRSVNTEDSEVRTDRETSAISEQSSETSIEYKYKQQIPETQCFCCGRNFRSVDKLSRHMMSHGTIAEAKCTFCHQNIKYKYNLKNHMKKCQSRILGSAESEDLEKYYPEFMAQVNAYLRDPSNPYPDLSLTPFEADKYGFIGGFDDRLPFENDVLIPSYNPNVKLEVVYNEEETTFDNRAVREEGEGDEEVEEGEEDEENDEDEEDEEYEDGKDDSSETNSTVTNRTPTRTTTGTIAKQSTKTATQSETRTAVNTPIKYTKEALRNSVYCAASKINASIAYNAVSRSAGRTVPATPTITPMRTRSKRASNILSEVLERTFDNSALETPTKRRRIVSRVSSQDTEPAAKAASTSTSNTVIDTLDRFADHSNVQPSIETANTGVTNDARSTLTPPNYSSEDDDDNDSVVEIEGIGVISRKDVPAPVPDAHVSVAVPPSAEVTPAPVAPPVPVNTPTPSKVMAHVLLSDDDDADDDDIVVEIEGIGTISRRDVPAPVPVKKILTVAPPVPFNAPTSSKVKAHVLLSDEDDDDSVVEIEGIGTISRKDVPAPVPVTEPVPAAPPAPVAAPPSAEVKTNAPATSPDPVNAPTPSKVKAHVLLSDSDSDESGIEGIGTISRRDVPAPVAVTEPVPAAVPPSTEVTPAPATSPVPVNAPTPSKAKKHVLLSDSDDSDTDQWGIGTSRDRTSVATRQNRADSESSDEFWGA